MSSELANPADASHADAAPAGPAASIQSGGRLARATTAFSALAQDPDLAAKAIDSGEFARDGAGDAGSAFRAMKVLSSEEELTEGWSALLALFGTLWDAGHHESCLVLIDTSRSMIDIPEVMASRIADIATRTRSGVQILRAERLFEEGDDEGARKLVDGLEVDPIGYAAALPHRSRNRRRLRMGSMAIAGGACVFLLSLSIWNFVTGFDSITRVPKIDVPSPSVALAGVFQGGEQSSTGVFGMETIDPHPGIVSHSPFDEPAGNEASPSGNFSQQGTDTVFPLQPAEGVDQHHESGPAREIRGQSQSDDLAVLESCVLGILSLREAREMIEERPLDGGTTQEEGVARLQEFAKKLEAACSKMAASDEEISEIGAGISRGLVIQTATGIIASP